MNRSGEERAEEGSEPKSATKCQNAGSSTLLIIGHRGNSRFAPENTLASFHSAMRTGADGIEFDVRLSRDGVAVCLHDATLERTGRRAARVDQLSVSELEKIEVGSWFNLRYPTRANREFERERIPTLDCVLAEMRAYERKKLYVELKCTESEAEALASAVIKIIRAHNLNDSVVIESFTLSAIEAVRRAAPELRTAALFERSLSSVFPNARKIIARAIASAADELALQRTLVNHRLVGAAHEAHLPLVAWTVDDPRWLGRALDYKLHALITNDPSLMLRELRKVQTANRV